MILTHHADQEDRAYQAGLAALPLEGMTALSLSDAIGAFLQGGRAGGEKPVRIQGLKR